MTEPLHIDARVAKAIRFLEGKPITDHLTPETVSEMIANAQFYTFPGTTTTVCCITTHNGFTVTGVSNVLDPVNFDPDGARETAFLDAREKLWDIKAFLIHEEYLSKSGEKK
jgi:hypothetical protein